MVELMISKGYIKLLFATESFAIGLDCPIRTAIFTGLTKYDGNTHRFLHPHEYTQMAGRAGRRGIDTIGYVVHCNNLFPCPSMTEYKQILCGRPQTLISKFHVNYNMVLSLLKHGNADFVSFTRKSMLQNETAKLIDGLERQMADACKEWKTKEGHILTTLRTPIDVCVKYNEYTQQWSGTINKKRKELERQLKQLEEAHKYIKSDARFVLDVTALETQYNKTRTEYHAAVEYVECQVKSVVHILEKGRFIVEEDTTSIPKLTLLGKQASQLAEGHPLVIVECLRDTDAFSEYSVYQIIGWLSCFVDIKVDEETRLQEPKCDTALCHLIQKTKSRIEYYAVTEREYGIHTGTNVGLQYDFIEIVCNWASGCNDEMECKLFLQSISELVSVGDFTKMCLKICNMVYELSNVCEMFGYTECLFKLSQIPKVLLKYIATTQSLYTGGGATRP
jgi:superfamily II RNA helicase